MSVVLYSMGQCTYWRRGSSISAYTAFQASRPISFRFALLSRAQAALSDFTLCLRSSLMHGPIHLFVVLSIGMV